MVLLGEYRGTAGKLLLCFADVDCSFCLMMMTFLTGCRFFGFFSKLAVAVKRVIPPQNDTKKGARGSNFWSKSTRNTTDTKMFDHSENEYGEAKKEGPLDGSQSQSQSGGGTGTASWAGMSFSMTNPGFLKSNANKKGKRQKGPTLKQLKEEFMEEMRYLSKLRHPNVTTVMGALIDKGDDPMVSFGNARVIASERLH